MKAITVRQRWAWAIAVGAKTVENRSRGTTYRGPLAIHAGLSVSARAEHDPRIVGLRRERPDMPDAAHALGAVIVVAELVDSHPDAGCCRPWGESEYQEAGGQTRRVIYHLVLADIRPLAEPVPVRGALGLWTLPEHTAALVADQLTAAIGSR